MSLDVLRNAVFFALLTAPAAAWAIVNASLSATFSSVDPECDQPRYQLDITADFSTDDDGNGNDYLASVTHDASGNYLSTRYHSVAGPGEQLGDSVGYLGGTPASASFHSSRPITVRLHDIPDPSGFSRTTKQNLEFASPEPVVATLLIDPGKDAVACRDKPFADPSLRLESLTNAGATTLGTTPTLLQLAFGFTDLTMAVPDRADLVAFFRAKCAHSAANESAAVDIDILLDGVPLAPTAGDDDAFCTANGTAGLDGWVMSRAIAHAVVQGPSVHTVQVSASTTEGSGTLSDSELVVMVPEAEVPPAFLAAAVLPWLYALRRWRRRQSMTAGVAAVCAASLAFGALPSRAGTVLESMFNPDSQVQLGSDGTQVLFLSPGSQALVFTLTRNTHIAIFVNAECSVAAADDTTWGHLDILLDSVPIFASENIDDSFCTSDSGGSGTDNWISAAIHVTAEVAPGTHTIVILADLEGDIATDQLWIDDLNVTLVGHEY